MQYLRKVCQLVVVTIGSLSASSVIAEGTDAGNVVINAVTLDFEVNTSAQSTTTSTSFTVDRKLILSVVTLNADWVTVVPGHASDTNGTVNALDYLITNTSNDATNVRIALVDRSLLPVTGFSPLVSGTFDPDPATGTVWYDIDDNDQLDGGESSATLLVGGLTELSIGSLAEGATANIKVVLDVDGTAGNGEHRTFTLVAAVADGSGIALVNDDSGNAAPGQAAANIPNDINAMEIVFADGPSIAEDVQYNFAASAVLGTPDADFDGQSADTSGFITAVALSIAKYVEVVYDPITGNRYDLGGNPIADPKAILGAVLMYVIGVVNENASLSATTVLINDDVPELDVAVGDQANPAPPIEIPATVSFAVGSDTPVFTLDQGNIEGDLNSIWYQICGASTATDTGFSASPGPELLNIDLGTCAAGEDGYVVYFVTIN